MKIGYIRVSDDDQTEALQIDALKAAGCKIVYGDHGVSGTVTTRKGLDEVLSDLKAGDTFVVWKLDRLGRSTIHLLLLLDDIRKREVDFVSNPRHRHNNLCGPHGLRPACRICRIRARTNPRTHQSGHGGGKETGQTRRGRPRKLSSTQIAHAARQIEAEGETIAGMAKMFGVATLTLSRALARDI